ncbi:MAG: VTT domain-containing protein [Candidatus Yonathbacteria bacterium]|nr:VTT domain-containing protein [Candidatus Yonathbacteria bacterium]
MLEQSIDFFILFVQDHRVLGYVVLFLAMVAEGEMFLIVAGILARLKALDLGDVLWVSFAGVMVGDIFWYWLGMFTARSRKFLFLMRAAERTVLILLPRFRENPFNSIFLSKFIYGANHAALVLSGIVRVKFQLFIKAELIASFAWVAIFSVVGFMFGHAALAVTHRAAQFALIALIFVIGFILIQRSTSKYYGQKELEESSDSHPQR